MERLFFFTVQNGIQSGWVCESEYTKTVKRMVVSALVRECMSEVLRTLDLTWARTRPQSTLVTSSGIRNVYANPQKT